MTDAEFERQKLEQWRNERERPRVRDKWDAVLARAKRRAAARAAAAAAAERA